MSESSPKAGTVSNFGTQNARAASDLGKAVKSGVSDLAHPSGPVRAVPPYALGVWPLRAPRCA